MEKINIAELLKDCPKGMELDCTMFDNMVFEKLECSPKYPVVIRNPKTNATFYLTEYGQYIGVEDAKCVIFPKGKTTWEGFQKPFEDGDILATDLGSVFYLNTRLNTEECYGCFVGKGGDGSFHICEPFAYKECCGLATEEEKAKLFKAIKDNGYRWNAENKTLEKLIEPKFEVGNRIRYKRGNRVKLNIVSININEQFYHTSDKGRVYFKYQDDWDLVPNKFDITTLVPFESRVLVREGKADVWQPSYYGFLNQRNKRFYTTTNTWSMCIPYNEDTKHLIGTTNDCEEFYKTWEERT